MEFKVYFRRPNHKLGMYMVGTHPHLITSINDAVNYVRRTKKHHTALGVINGNKHPNQPIAPGNLVA